jgi:hypothetical protein
MKAIENIVKLPSPQNTNYRQNSQLETSHGCNNWSNPPGQNLLNKNNKLKN